MVMKKWITSLVFVIATGVHGMARGQSSVHMHLVPTNNNHFAESRAAILTDGAFTCNLLNQPNDPWDAIAFTQCSGDTLATSQSTSVAVTTPNLTSQTVNFFCQSTAAPDVLTGEEKIAFSGVPEGAGPVSANASFRVDPNPAVGGGPDATFVGHFDFQGVVSNSARFYGSVFVAASVGIQQPGSVVNQASFVLVYDRVNGFQMAYLAPQATQTAPNAPPIAMGVVNGANSVFVPWSGGVIDFTFPVEVGDVVTVNSTIGNGEVFGIQSPPNPPGLPVALSTNGVAVSNMIDFNPALGSQTEAAGATAVGFTGWSVIDTDGP